jgi:hypothetical protein
MTCDELKALVMDYALGALVATKRAACDKHLAREDHDGCLEALRAARAVVALGPATLPLMAPTAHTWAAIAVPARRRGAWLAATGWLVAGAAVIALILAWRLYATR